MKKIAYVFDGDDSTIIMFQKKGWDLYGIDTEEAPTLIVFTGGEDVTPAYYGEKNVASYCNPQRDTYEKGIFDSFPDVSKVGICRGGQFLNVMSGGRMFQDTDRHDRYHNLKDLLTGKTHFVSSTHHQMMRPSGLGEIVAVADESTYRMADQAHHEKSMEFYQDIEVVYYPRTKSLCFQPHPEYGGKDGTFDYFFELLERYFKFDSDEMKLVYDSGEETFAEEIEFDGAFGA
jgi:GMP synthase-like glutamine amidotransferase